MVPLYSVDFRMLAFTDYYGQIEASTPYDNLRQRNLIRPEISLDLLDYTASFTLSGEFYYDYYADEKTPDYFNILQECYFSFYLDKTDIIIGQKFTNTGKVDIFSPLNVYNGIYRETLSMDEPYQKKRPDAQLEIKYYIDDDSSLELIYIPFPRPDYQGKGDLKVSDGLLNFTLDKESTPYLLENSHSFYLAYNRFGFDTDMQLFYGYYTGRGYNFSLEDLSLVGGNLVGTMDKTYNRIHTVGGAFSFNIGSFAFNEEIGLNITEDFNGDDIGIKNSDITINSQITKTLFGRVTSNLNIIYQHIFNYNKGSRYNNDVDDQLYEAINDIHMQPTDNILVLVLHLHDYYLREKLYVALNTALLYPRIYIGPRVNYKLKDYLTIETGVDYFTNKYENYLLDENLGGDNFFIRIKYEY